MNQPIDPQHNAGGPAFPRVENSITGEPSVVAFGLSARDYFAAKAMQAIITSPHSNPDEGDLRLEEVARGAYQYADAMLAAREES